MQARVLVSLRGTFSVTHWEGNTKVLSWCLIFREVLIYRDLWRSFSPDCHLKQDCCQDWMKWAVAFFCQVLKTFKDEDSITTVWLTRSPATLPSQSRAIVASMQGSGTDASQIPK